MAGLEDPAFFCILICCGVTNKKRETTELMLFNIGFLAVLKPLIPPTYTNFGRLLKSCDVINSLSPCLPVSPAGVNDGISGRCFGIRKAKNSSYTASHEVVFS
jgi:hypothetical protein